MNYQIYYFKFSMSILCLPLLLGCAAVGLPELEFFDGKFNELTFTDSPKVTCETFDYYELVTTLSFTYNDLPPHYRFRLIVDFFLAGDGTGASLLIKTDGSLWITKDLTTITTSQDFNVLCQPLSPQAGFGAYALDLDFTHGSYQIEFTFEVTAPSTSARKLLLRNYQLFIGRCHKTCASCYGPYEGNCGSCFGGVSPVGGVCDDRICNQPGRSHRFLKNYLCERECIGLYVDDYRICSSDNRVQPVTFTNLNSTCISFNLPSAITVAYVSYQLILQNVQAGTYFETYMKDVRQSKVLRGSSPFYLLSEQNAVVYQLVESGTTDTLSVWDRIVVWNVVRPIEYCVKSDATIGSITSIAVHSLACALDCQACDGIESCSNCVSGKYPYQKTQCLSSFTTSSFLDYDGKIKEYDEVAPFTYYLMKAYHDFRVSPYVFTRESFVGHTELKGHPYGNFEKLRVFGGPLTWFKAKYYILFSIPNPNYMRQVFFRVVLGDYFFPGTFEYSVDNEPVVVISQTHSSLSQNQFQGIAAISENCASVQRRIYSNLNTLRLTVECKGPDSRGIHDAWCAIYAILITVSECPPFCQNCDNNGVCVTWSPTIPAQYDQNLQRCNDGYFLKTNPYSCEPCPDNCMICKSSVRCTTCRSDWNNVAGRCDCGNFCYSCDLSCLSCAGPGAYQCVDCDNNNNRYFNLNACPCLTGFEEQEKNPKCRKALQKCQIECLLCSDGKCFECGYSSVLNHTTFKCDYVMVYPQRNYVNFEQFQMTYHEENVPNAQFTSFDYFTYFHGFIDKGIGYQYDELFDRWSPILGDGLIREWEECDDANNLMLDGCYLSEFNCDMTTCANCDGGRCVKCKIQHFKLNAVDNKCYYSCEMCHQSHFYQECNQYLTTDPSQCQKICGVGCVTCLAGDCLECEKFGYRLIENRCYPVCGDGLLVVAEQCDYIILDPFTSCTTNCELFCSQDCKKDSCAFGTCLECEEGFQLMDQGKLCKPVCGDMLVAIGQEECDDGNDEAYDGCFDCEFSCDPGCWLCLRGLCVQCLWGWQLINGRCVAVCGDGIAAQDIEQCDDGNSLQLDGCYECKFDCPKNCIDCAFGQCLECEVGYELNRARCKNICGDGMFIEGLEDCDDGNTRGQDGCSTECRIEKGWICQFNALGVSECFFSDPPSPIFNQKRLGESTISVTVTFDQLLLYREDPKIEAKIASLNAFAYNITSDRKIIQKLEKGILLMDLEIVLVIEFEGAVNNPLLEINFKKNLFFNALSYELEPLKSQLKLPIILLAKEQLQQIEAAVQFTTYITYSLIFIGVLAIILGQTEILWNLLDLFQYLSYMKFINIKFPTLLQSFFEVFDIISMDQFTQTRLDFIYIQLNFGVYPYLEAPGKFKEYETNAVFLINIMSSITCYVLQFLQYFSFAILSKLFTFLMKYKSNFIIFRFIKSINFSLRDFLSTFFYSNLIRLFMASFYDIAFACLIQIGSAKLSTKFEIVNFYASFFVISIALSIIGRFITIQRGFALKSSIRRRSQYSTLFSEQKRKGLSAWGQQFQQILLFKKLVFALSIVLLQDNGTIQSLIVSINSLLFLAYLIATNPLKSETASLQMVITELFISLNAIIIIVFNYQHNFNLSESEIYIISWVVVTNCSVILLFQLLTDVRQQFYIVYDRLKHILYPEKSEKTKTIFLEQFQNPSTYFV